MHELISTLQIDWWDILAPICGITLAVLMDRDERQPTIVRRVLAFTGIFIFVSVWWVIAIRAID